MLARHRQFAPLQKLRQSPIAIHTNVPNRQHHGLPSAFFQCMPESMQSPKVQCTCRLAHLPTCPAGETRTPVYLSKRVQPIDHRRRNSQWSATRLTEAEIGHLTRGKTDQ